MIALFQGSLLLLFLKKEERMVNFDVESLFMNVPVVTMMVILKIMVGATSNQSILVIQTTTSTEFNS